MCISQLAILLALLILALSDSGCDPGYNYQSVDAKGQPLQWSETVEGVRFSARSHPG
jgi:hypothetical protein